MISNPKSTKDAPPESPARDTPPAAETPSFSAFAAIFHNGVERLAEMQKLTLDIVANQATDVLGAWKHVFPVPPSMPGATLLEAADQGIERMARTQKGMIDLLVQQSAQALEMSKERSDSASKWTSGAAALLSDAADRTVAAQKILLDFAAEQNKVVAAAMKRQATLAGSTPAAAAVDTVQRNVEVAIETQKELMEAATKPLKAAAGKQAA
jgi:hypothetical protein